MQKQLRPSREAWLHLDRESNTEKRKRFELKRLYLRESLECWLRSNIDN